MNPYIYRMCEAEAQMLSRYLQHPSTIPSHGVRHGAQVQRTMYAVVTYLIVLNARKNPLVPTL